MKPWKQASKSTESSKSETYYIYDNLEVTALVNLKFPIQKHEKNLYYYWSIYGKRKTNYTETAQARGDQICIQQLAMIFKIF